VALAAPAGLPVQVGCPRRGVAAVVGEDAQGVAGTGIGCPAELDHGAVAGLLGDRGGANLGSGVGEVADPVQDRADLGQDLGQVDLADARQRLEDRGLGMLAQGGGQGPIQVGEAAKQAAQQPDLDADAVGQDLGIELVDCDRGGPQPVKQLGWGAPAAVAVATQEGGQAGLAQPLGGLRGGIALQDLQRDVAVQTGKDGLAPGQWASSRALSWLVAVVLASRWSVRRREMACR
jgi:hypothetical protein